jgi:hypothetical protein
MWLYSFYRLPAGMNKLKIERSCCISLVDSVESNFIVSVICHRDPLLFTHFMMSLKDTCKKRIYTKISQDFPNNWHIYIKKILR